MAGFSSRISGLGAYLPARIMTNDELSEQIDVSGEWIYQRTGIRQRHIAAITEATSDLAARAAHEALQDAGLAAKAVDMILVATTTPDMMMPSTASQVQNKIGAVNAAAMDIGAACTGFVYGLAVADQFVRTGSMNHIVVVGAETMTRYVDWTERGTCVLFGDGAGAAVVSRSEGNNGLFHFHLGANGGSPKEWLMLMGSGSARNGKPETAPGVNTIAMNGPAVFEFGARILVEIVDRAITEAHLRSEDIDLIIPHQANRRIVEYAAEKSGIPFDRYYMNIDQRANTAAASIPIAMNDARAASRMRRGNTIILAGFGAGFTWGGVTIRY